MNSGTLGSTNKSLKSKRETFLYRDKPESVKPNINMDKGRVSVKLLAKHFESLTETNQILVYKNHSNSEVPLFKNMKEVSEERSLKTEVQEMPNSILENYGQLLFTGKLRSKTESNSQTNGVGKKIIQKKNAKGYSEADDDDGIELLRQVISQEMTEEFENMQKDGFIKEYENIVSIGESSIVTTESKCNCHEDDFSESLGELEDGAYIVESYNDEDRELIIIQLHRKAVNLNIFQSIKVTESSDLVFFKNEKEPMYNIDDHEEIVNEPSEEEPTYEDIEPIYENICRITAMEDHEVFYENTHILPMADEVSSQWDEENSSQSDEKECPQWIEDERIGESYRSVNNSVRGEILCENQGNIMIEKVRYPEISIEDNRIERTSETLSRKNSANPKKRLRHFIKELKDTETKYVEGLKKVVRVYIPYIEKHYPYLSSRQVELVGNISIICEMQKKFLEAVQNCAEDVDSIATVFIEHTHLFEQYPLYLPNKPKSDKIMSEFQPILKQMQEYYGERLDFSAYLLTPLQRLGKYILLMEGMEKVLNILQKSCERVHMAINMIRSIMSMGNDLVATESIQNSPLSRADYGSFIMSDKFTIISPRRLESMVFLFSNVVVFTREDENSIEVFTYYESIKIDELTIASFEDGTIHLIDFMRTKRSRLNPQRYTFVLETKIDKVKSIWRKTIEQMLWDQLAKDKANAVSRIIK